MKIMILSENFKNQAKAISKYKRNRRIASFLKFVFPILVLVGLTQFNIADYFLPLPDTTPTDDQIIQVQKDIEETKTSSFSLDDTDKIRDPIFLFTNNTNVSSNNKLEIRFRNKSTATQVSGPVFYVSDRMLGASAHLMTALPSTAQDFALMGSHSVNDRLSFTDNISNKEDFSIIQSSSDIGLTAGWGNIEGNAEVENKEDITTGDTSIKLGSSVFQALPSKDRIEVGREFIIKTLLTRSLKSVLKESGLSDIEIQSALEASARELKIVDVPSGSIVAFKVAQSSTTDLRKKIIQLSIFTETSLVGSIGIDNNSLYSKIDNPWNKETLGQYTDSWSAKSNKQRYRIMDGVYSAGIRNNIPPNIISEVISQMARSYDLGQFIGPNDKISIIYSENSRESKVDAGHVLYASVDHNNEKLECYILKPSIESNYTCMTQRDTVNQKLGPVGFVIPVNGVLRSGFGPRRHPILNRVRLHKGVDWAAPRGTPIVAAFDGVIDFAGRNGGYGNYIRIEHENGLSTAYAHMQKFDNGITRGSSVSAGDVIGYVGSTGLSTGPHLHFELRVDQEAVDPLSYEVQDFAQSNSQVDKLIDRIITVESAGNATAKNPRSSATGLGQFIDSTWLRMMRSYRPDLANSMSRSQLLWLRTEPSIAREMVHNLATENEADLRAAGLSASAGNLYLAHFLGSTGAINVLSVSQNTNLIDIVGGGVISANPFLRGKTTGWVANWAERKMTGSSRNYRARRTLPKATRIKNARFKSYSSAIDALLTSINKNAI